MKRLTVQQKLAILVAVVVAAYLISSPFLPEPEPPEEQSTENLILQAERAREGGAPQ